MIAITTSSSINVNPAFFSREKKAGKGKRCVAAARTFFSREKKAGKEKRCVAAARTFFSREKKVGKEKRCVAAAAPVGATRLDRRFLEESLAKTSMSISSSLILFISEKESGKETCCVTAAAPVGVSRVDRRFLEESLAKTPADPPLSPDTGFGKCLRPIRKYIVIPPAVSRLKSDGRSQVWLSEPAATPC